MRSFYITFLFFLTLGNAFAANYYEDAQSKYDLKDFKSSIQLLEKSIKTKKKEKEKKLKD